MAKADLKLFRDKTEKYFQRCQEIRPDWAAALSTVWDEHMQKQIAEKAAAAERAAAAKAKAAAKPAAAATGDVAPVAPVEPAPRHSCTSGCGLRRSSHRRGRRRRRHL